MENRGCRMHYSVVTVEDAFGNIDTKRFDFSIEAEDYYLTLVRMYVQLTGWAYRSDITHRPLEESVTFESGITVKIEHKC